LILAVIEVIVAISFVGCADDGARPQPLPALSLGIDFDGHELTTAQFRDKALVVTFWATWAVPCHLQLSVLDTLQSQYGDRLQIVAVACHQTPDTVVQFLVDHPHSFPVTLDADGTAMAGVTQSNDYPTAVLFDADGEIRFEKRGYRQGDHDLQDAVRQVTDNP
jgi:thiol-disulfide isomerase/thioredoxin